MEKLKRRYDVLFIDWAYEKADEGEGGKKQSKFTVLRGFNGRPAEVFKTKESLKTLLDETAYGAKIYTENFPDYLAGDFLDKDCEFYRLPTFITKRERDKLGWDKTDENDARLIKLLAGTHPEWFRPWHGTSELMCLYRKFKMFQKNRNQDGNRGSYNARGEVWDETEKELIAIEQKFLKKAMVALAAYPIADWLLGVKGIGPSLACFLVGTIDKNGIENFPTVSHLWSYCGLAVNGEGKAAHRERGKSINYNDDAKSMLLGVLGDSFVKQRTPVYRDIYDKEREKLDNLEFAPGELAAKFNGYKPKEIKLHDGHAHKRAVRKMVKAFLADLWEKWCTIKNLPVRPAYAVEKLGHKKQKRI